MKDGNSILAIYGRAHLSVKELHDCIVEMVEKCETAEDAIGLKKQLEFAEIAARITQDIETEVTFRECKIRCEQYLGRWSKAQEKGSGRPSKEILPIDGKNLTKSDKLLEVGLSTSTAHRYEELVPTIPTKEEESIEIVKEATETYFADQRERQEPGTLKGLKETIRNALVEKLGEPSKKTNGSHKKQGPDLLVHFLYSANWSVEKGNFNPYELAQEVKESFAKDEVSAVEAFIPLLKAFTKHVKERFSNVF